jgi:hypothetical protein
MTNILKKDFHNRYKVNRRAAGLDRAGVISATTVRKRLLSQWDGGRTSMGPSLVSGYGSSERSTWAQTPISTWCTLLSSPRRPDAVYASQDKENEPVNDNVATPHSWRLLFDGYEAVRQVAGRLGHAHVPPAL